MPLPTLLYKTTDLLKWGVGLGRRLHASEVDTNFWNIRQTLNDILSNPTAPNNIDHFSIDANNNLIVHMADATTFTIGPLPIAEFHDRGAFAAVHYNYGDIFTSGTGLYMVIQEHNGVLPFNPAATGISGPLYRLLFDASGLTMTYLDDGYPADGVTLNTFEVFSVADVGVFLVLSDHPAVNPFDQTALDGDGNPLYKKIFSPIQTAIARIQFQYPGSFPADSSLMWKLIQDDTRSLIIPAGWTNSVAHLEIAVTTEIVFTFKHGATTVGTLTFSPATLPDGSGGQFGTFAGIGLPAGLAQQELLRMIAPGTADTTGRFLTVAVEGSYAP
jgi:hypothetical protein